MRALRGLPMAMNCVAIACVILVFGSFVGYAQNPNPTAGAPAGQCTITGEVRKPGPQPFKAGETLTLSAAILRAAGITEWADRRKVRVIRQNKDGKPETLTFNLQAIEEKGLDDPILHDGDRIFVPRISLGPLG